jgi:hypothetical protein
LVAEELEEGEGGVVDLVAGLALPHPTPEGHHQAHQGVLGRLRRRQRLGEDERGSLHASSMQPIACSTQVVFRDSRHVVLDDA